ncbi:MAG: hypothetical protein ACO1SV_15340 [Fimbriimonas sp.]
MARKKRTEARYLAVVPGADMSRKGCHTIWMEVGVVIPSDDREDELMVEFHTPISRKDTVYLRKVLPGDEIC